VHTVLAVEPDPKQAAALKRVVKDRVGANFVLAESKDAAISAIKSAVPDLILLTPLVSPRDENEIADLIRELDGAEHTQTLTIPLLDLGTTRPAKKKKRGLLSALTGEVEAPSAPSGCDPAAFADEIANYLQQAEHAKAEAELARERRAKKPKRKKRDAPEEVPPDAAAASGSSNYWAWDTSSEAPVADDVPQPVVETPVSGVRAEAPAVSVEALADANAEATPAGPSSWDNPWDVSAPSIWKEPAPVQQTYLDDHIITGPDPFVAAPSETVDALLGQPASTPAAADQLVAATIQRGEFGKPQPEAVVDAPVVSAEPSETLRAFEQPEIAPAIEASEPEPRMQPDSEIVKAKLPTRAESGALLALQADVARLREQRASTDATLVAAKAAQERAAIAASEAAAHAKREADRRADEAASRAREEAKAERRARELAEKRVQEEAQRRAETEKRARQDAERLAREAADRAREEAAARARQEAAAERKAREQAERQAREEAERRVEAERKAREEAERQVAAERRAREQAERRAKEETARLEREARERQAHAEAERKAREAAEAHAAAERKAREEAEKRSREEAERVARDAERKAHEEADRRARKAEQAARDEAARIARDAEARAKEEAAIERRARQKAEQRAEAERQARQESERRAEAERKAREQAEQAVEAARSEARPARKTAPVRKTKRAAAEPKRANAEPKRAKKDTRPRAIQDEWGLYDPHAAGFEALFAKLESIENGETEAEQPTATRAPRPLAMWAFQYEPVAEPPAVPSRKGRDDFRALVSQFSIPHAVAAVSYATGVRIREVQIRAVSTRRARSEADPRVVILSRKLLKAARHQAATERLTARR
jgi:hypothetical protein